MSDVPALTISLPAIRSAGDTGERFDSLVRRYRHATVRDGGFYEASWEMPLRLPVGRDEQRAAFLADSGRPRFSAAELQGNEATLRRWFETPYLMYHVEERVAGVPTWEGVVWEMELTLDGLTRRVSMHAVYNAVRADYTDEAGNVQITDWFTADESIALYGRREMIIAERYVSAEEAEEAARNFLAQHAWPQPQVVQIAATRAPGLFVQAVGYCVTANFQYVDTTAADGETGDISAFVRRIVQYDCEFLQAGNIETNTLQRRRRFDGLRRCWDALQELAEMGDEDGAPWLVAVYNGRRLDYEKADNTPTLFWRGAQRGVGSEMGALNPWHVRPGVMRDLTSVSTGGRPGAFLQTARDTWVDEVEMSQGRDVPVFKPGGFDPLAILRAKDQYMDWLADEEEETGG